MAIDATGTPTTHFSLPTYLTGFDAPSGLGFNAAMAAVDDALYTRAPKPGSSTGIGQALGWDGAAFSVVDYSLSGAASIGVVIALS